MTRDQLGSKRSSRVQAVSAAEEAGWSWRAHHACSPSVDGVESIVLRFALGGAFPWITRRVVAWWRSPGPGRPYKFEAAFGWTVYGTAIDDQVRLGGNEIAAHLRRGGRPVPDADQDAA